MNYTHSGGKNSLQELINRILRLFKLFLMLACSASLNACISPVDINTKLKNDYLVVDGFITTEPGPHILRLTELSKFAGALGGGEIIKQNDATVFIIDNEGQENRLASAN